MFICKWKHFALAAAAGFSFCTGILTEQAGAATPTAVQALSLKPIQKDVDYDRPSGDAADKCTVKAESRKDASGWVVRDGSGQFLRQYLDTNKDNKVDQWRYFKDGVEVYRDIDSNYNGNADQYRWLGTAGIRWGTDKDEDRRIDSWKVISAEEVSAEVIAALRDRDATRFKRLLLTGDELKSLGFGTEVAKDLAKRISGASSNFATVAGKQKGVNSGTNWIHFGGNLPGVLPAGTDGSTKDVTIYDNVTAVVETAGKHAQVAIGTLVQVGGTWKVVDLPQGLVGGQANVTDTGLFLKANHRPVPAEAAAPTNGLSQEIQKLIQEFETIDRSLQSSVAASQKATLNQRRANVLEKLVAASSTAEDRDNWIRQFADVVGGATQTGEYPGGLERMKKFYETLTKDSKASNSAAYVKYRYVNGWYSQSIQDPKADFAKIQDQWLGELADFVEAYPKAEDSADAMLQIALAREFSGKDDEAKQWYSRITKDFATSDLAKKAAGAVRRLDSVGKTIQLSGRTVEGRSLNTSSYKGRVLLIHYWATWCEPCKKELTTLKNMQAKYSKRGFSLVGVSLDNDKKSLSGYLRSARLSWPQLYEDGGLDSRLANELGILTLPAMMLVDKQGKVISRSMHAAELDAELGKILR